MDSEKIDDLSKSVGQIDTTTQDIKELYYQMQRKIETETDEMAAKHARDIQNVINDYENKIKITEDRVKIREEEVMIKEEEIRRLKS